MYELRIKRAYLPAEPADGHRILIDRLWPRGLSKEAAAIDEWAKEVTPLDRSAPMVRTQRRKF